MLNVIQRSPLGLSALGLLAEMVFLKHGTITTRVMFKSQHPLNDKLYNIVTNMDTCIPDDPRKYILLTHERALEYSIKPMVELSRINSRLKKDWHPMTQHRKINKSIS